MTRTRGRPKQYDEDAALHAAAMLFWSQGFSATSLDDLAQAMNMTRPSIYNAFGNKQSIYRKTLARFCGLLNEGLRDTLVASTQLRPGLLAFYDKALDVYCGTTPPMGCLMVCTAPSESVAHPEIGRDLSQLILTLDDSIAQRLSKAQQNGELAQSVDVQLAAGLLQATLHTLALRARTGESRKQLRALAQYAVTTVVGQ